MGAVDGHDIELVRADNAGPFTLTGTNTWLVGRDPCWIVDPGPALDPHVTAVLAAAAGRGGVAGIVVTHDHADHMGAAPAVRAATGARLWAASGTLAAEPLADGDRLGPLRVVATPGHSPDHVALVAGSACCTGDAVLGSGSVFVAPGRGSLAGYLAALRRLQTMALDVLLPGHGPVVCDPDAKLAEYIAHRRAREEALIAALGAGRRTVDELLDAVWGDVPGTLRRGAAVTLAAHLDKLAEEDALPQGVERPDMAGLAGAAAP